MTDESPKTRVIEFTSAGSKFRVTIGEKDRVTYGQIAPGTTRGGGGYALRIYEGASKDLTRAVFAGVDGFREVGLPVQRLAVRRFGAEEWKFDDSSYTGKRAETIERKWVDVDEPLPEANDLTADLDADFGEASPESLGYPTVRNRAVRP